MNDDYTVIGLDRYIAEHDELVKLRRENEALGAALADMAEKHLALQGAVAGEDE